MTTAAALIIGNEILTGKVQEQNVAVLARTLFELGVELQRVVICEDVEATIAADLRQLSETHDAVFTSGGVGPTHDDVTMRAVARCFDRRLVRSAEVEVLLRRQLGERLTDRHLVMADLPEGFVLVRAAEMRWPAVLVENVYVLPGLPEVFRMKLPAIRLRFGGGPGFVSRAVFTLCDEGELAELLDRLSVEHRLVSIGSYPVWRDAGYSVKLTFDGRDPRAVDAAAEALIAALPQDMVVPGPA